MNEATYFRLRLDDPKVFIKIFEILGKLLDFAEIDISSNFLKLVAMDASHVLHVDLTLPGDFFNERTIHIPKRIRLDLSEINKVFKRFRSEVMFLMDSSYENKLIVRFQSNESKRSFRVKLQDPINEDLSNFNVGAYNASMSIGADQLAELVGDALLANDYATFILGANSESVLNIDATSDDSTEFNADFKNFLEKPTFKGKQESIYSLIYLSDIVKLREVSTKVNLQFSTGKPLELVYPLVNDGKIVLTLAPRVEDNDETPEPKKKRGKPLRESEKEPEKESDEESGDTELEDDPDDENEVIHEHIGETYEKNQKEKA